jgi:hypothetical protein
MEQTLNSTEIKHSVPSFIDGNTVPLSREELESNHIIPVFGKDNEPTISHTEFINSVTECAELALPSFSIGAEEIRGSHPIKGRIAEARLKAAKELLSHEKTLYYERMMFCFTIPSITETIDGKEMSLVVGGVKCYSHDNLYSSKGSKEHFQIFIGFQVQVCSNLCVWTDGSLRKTAVRSIDELQSEVYQLIVQFNAAKALSTLENWTDLHLTESQFAHFVGKARLYPHTPKAFQSAIPELTLTDYQIGSIVKGFYKDPNFSNSDGSLSLWNAYNLLTGSNKSSYIDSFLDRSASASNVVLELEQSLAGGNSSWYLN